MYILFIKVGQRYYDIENGCLVGSCMGIRRDDVDDLLSVAGEATKKILAENPRGLVKIAISKYL